MIIIFSLGCLVAYGATLLFLVKMNHTAPRGPPACSCQHLRLFILCSPCPPHSCLAFLTLTSPSLSWPEMISADVMLFAGLPHPCFSSLLPSGGSVYHRQPNFPKGLSSVSLLGLGNSRDAHSILCDIQTPAQHQLPFFFLFWPCLWQEESSRPGIEPTLQQ